MSLAPACRLFVPQKDNTDLLRSCLWEGDGAREAFQRWSRSPQHAIDALQADGSTKRRLLPLLSASLERAGIVTPDELRPLLRAASLYEELRSQAYRDIAAMVLSKLRSAEIPFLGLRGIYLSIGAYGEKQCRHCHDIDLLLPAASLGQAVEFLSKECEFTAAPVGEFAAGDPVLYHSSGLPLALHCAAVNSPAYAMSWTDLQVHHMRVSGYGTQFDTLAPTISLVQLILHASTGVHSRSLVWVCDAWKLIDTHTIDWDRLLEMVRGSVMLLPVSIALEYLGKELKAPIPADVLEGMNAGLNELSPEKMRLSQEVMLAGLQAALPGGRKALLRNADTAGQRLALLRAFLLPSASMLRATGKIDATGAYRYRTARLLRGAFRIIRRYAERPDGTP